jgi:ribonuclease HII
MTITEHEKNRLEKLTKFEKQAKEKGFRLIAGIDEAGRGPLAGPVVAVACLLLEDVLIEDINDSKKLTPAMRKTLYEKLISTPQVLYGIGIVDVQEIDRINILQATFLAMKQAVEKLPKRPDYIMVDGNLAPDFQIPTLTLIDGDALSYLIAMASVIAKETRDRLMVEYHKTWPQYGFDRHKGYGTRDHLAAIQKYGPSPLHRMTFEPLKSHPKIERV